MISFYDYINNINDNTKFTYLIIIIIFIILATRINSQFPNIVPLIMGLSFALLVIYFINEKQLKSGNNFLNLMNLQLKSNNLKNTKHLHNDSEIVHFLIDIREYKFYNPANFKYLVELLDNFLLLVTDLEKGVHNMGDTYEVLLEQKLKILNAMHAFIYKIPQSVASVADTKHKQALERLEKLLNYHIDQTYQYVSYYYSNKPIDINTKFLYKNSPTPFNNKVTNYDYF
jgi:hypothetical protein